jgi:hypothetical protein
MHQRAAEVVEVTRPVMKPTAKPPAVPARTEISTRTIKFSNNDLFWDTLIGPRLTERSF